MISTLFPYLNHITSRKARSGDAAPQVPGSHRTGPDHLSLSEEALKYDDRDRAIDEYYANLAEQRGADDPDVQLFTQMMGNNL